MVISSRVQSFFMEIREMTKMCNDVICLFRFATVALHFGNHICGMNYFILYLVAGT